MLLLSFLLIFGSFFVRLIVIYPNKVSSNIKHSIVEVGTILLELTPSFAHFT